MYQNSKGRPEALPDFSELILYLDEPFVSQNRKGRPEALPDFSELILILVVLGLIDVGPKFVLSSEIL